ncbi:WPP domain-interacting tail-anchored protein 2 [Linum grandiflorum]
MEGTSSITAGALQEVDTVMDTLAKVDLDLNRSSEKLGTLHVILMHLLAWDNDREAIAAYSYISASSIEKALELDLLSGILDSEVKEVESFMDCIQAELVDAHYKISKSPNASSMIEERLVDCEESFKKAQDQVLDVKMKSTKLQRAFLALRHETLEDAKAIALSLTGNVEANSKQHRHILRMLDKSLARELDLEKRLSESKQSEEQMKLKLHYTEQVVFRMEEAGEIVLGRFLEAENAAEVFMGVSKELVTRHQIVQFNLTGSFQRETELRSQLEDCIQKLDARDATLQKLEISIAKHIAKSNEIPELKNRVKSLEEQLRKAESSVKTAKSVHEADQEQLVEMDSLVESLRENIFEAETRAENAETKVSQLTDTNVELSEEISFLKSGRDSDAKKVSSLEKQLMELEIQAQHSKVSSEASQEQQNMLYSAIWDMETLIEDLKSKVSKAEGQLENSEEQCIVLSETNADLNDEISLLRTRIRKLEKSLDQANISKAESAEDIKTRTKLVMDMVFQLAKERERIQDQFLSLGKENETLKAKLSLMQKYDFLNSWSGRIGDDLDPISSPNDLSKESTATEPTQFQKLDH